MRKFIARILRLVARLLLLVQIAVIVFAVLAVLGFFWVKVALLLGHY
jgi:hypothetical protein